MSFLASTMIRSFCRGASSLGSTSTVPRILAGQCQKCAYAARIPYHSAQPLSRSLGGLRSRFAPLSRIAQSMPRLFGPLRQTSSTAAPEVSARGQKIVGTWLLGCAGMVFGAIVLGGVTRLTESGLSMVEWRLIKDMHAPRSQTEWEEEFERYKNFPEYKFVIKNREMTLSDFKFIWYMEWFHRLWGRAVGVAFVVPAIYFWRKGWITKAMKPRMFIYGAFIAFQGFLGWYMVKSGLKDDNGSTYVPRVSQYRLAAHLSAAMGLYALFFFQGLSHVLKPQHMPQIPQIRRLTVLSHIVMIFVFLTSVSGAFVAGLDAGLTYNSWPMMADKWIPTDLWALTPKWKNNFDNPTTVQFNHRHMGESTVFIIAGLWYISRKAPLAPRARMLINALLAMALVQATLGITTLLTYVPTHTAATHQAGSIALLSLALAFTREFMRRVPK